MDFETQYYNQKQLNNLHQDQIKALKAELDVYQQRKWRDFLAWLYKREMIGWILACVIGFAWIYTWAINYFN